MAAHRMLAAWHHGEAQLLVVARRLIEIFDDNDEMIDTENHERQQGRWSDGVMECWA